MRCAPGPTNTPMMSGIWVRREQAVEVDRLMVRLGISTEENGEPEDYGGIMAIASRRTTAISFTAGQAHFGLRRKNMNLTDVR